MLSFKNDIIYATDNYSNGFSAAIVSKIIKKPMILRFTGDSVWESAFNSNLTKSDIESFQNQNHGFKTKLKIWRRNFILKTAKIVITDCEFLKNFLAKIGTNPKKIKVINNAIEPFADEKEFDEQEFREKLGLEGNIILTMCRLTPWKGVEALIEIMPKIKGINTRASSGLCASKSCGVLNPVLALGHRKCKRVLFHFTRSTSLIKSESKDAKLVVAGDGPEFKKLQTLIEKMNLTKSVILLGNVTDRTTKNRLLKICQLFVLNTFYEGMSNTLLEAMSAEKPIITTNSGGNPELIDKTNGILVEYNNKEQLANSIIKILDDETLSLELGEKSKEKSKNFTWENLVNKNIQVIDDLLEK